MKILQGYKKILAGVFALLLFSSCSTLEGILNFTRPTAEVEKVELTGISFDRIDLLFRIRVQNPNEITVRLAQLDYDLGIEEGSLIQGSFDKGLELKASASSVIDVPVSIGVQKILSVADAAKQKDELAYGIEIGLGFAIPGYGTLRVPVKHQGTFPVPKLPAIRIDALKVTRMTLTRIDLEIDMNVENPNAFALNMKNFTYDLSIAGRKWAEGVQVRPLGFPRKNESRVTLPLSLNIVEVGRSVVDLLSGNQTLNYRLNGNMLLDTNLPLLKEYPFTFNTEGEVKVFR